MDVLVRKEKRPRGRPRKTQPQAAPASGSPERVGKNRAAIVLGVSRSWSTELFRRGVLPIDDDGRIGVDRLKEAYARFQRENPRPGMGGPAKEALDLRRAEQVEVRTQMLRQRHVLRSSAEAAAAEIVAALEGELRGLSARVAPRLLGLDSVVDIKETIAGEVHALLERLSEGPPPPEAAPEAAADG